jgi:hypothetical protein
VKQLLRNLVVLAAAAFLCGAANADALTSSVDRGFGRLLFTLSADDHVTAATTGQVLTISFSRKVSLTPQAVAQALPGYISSARADADGKTFRFALSQPVRLHTSSATDKFAVDLLPQSFSGTAPDLPQPRKAVPKPLDPDNLPVLKVRAGAYQHFTRVVFDWPRNVPYSVSSGPGKLTVRFEAGAKPDFSAITRQTPPWVRPTGWHVAGQGIVVELAIDAASGFHDFRDGTHVVVDVLAPKTDADAYNPPGDAKPKATTLAQNKASSAVPAKATPVVTAKAAPLAKPAPAKTAPVPAPAKPVAAPQPAPAPQPAKPETPATVQTVSPAADQATVQASDGKLTRDGAVLTFQGAGRRGAAVFTRGRTAWIILADAPPLDIAKLKTQLGNFPEAVEAAAGGNFTQLRLTLREPQSIAAFAEGANLKVVIARTVNPTAIALGFSRNQDNNRASLSTLLPGASKVMRLVDPVAGDELLVVPGTPGRQTAAERDYIEFSMLQTAAGVVVLPLVDDLSVAANATRITITRPNGLSLTSAAMPTAGSPESLAGGNSPCFLDLARWRPLNGSFLATERRLRAAVSRLPSAAANKARQRLARFYLANGFAAEALGQIDLMQSVDPGMASDPQLQTMRAAADLAMGRYRDAHNALAAQQFDADRHAALWRGLTEAALENWKDARSNFDRAAPVLNAYEPGMQARVRLAAAETAMGMGMLEVADAQLARLPDRLDGKLGWQATLDRARLYAAEGRKTKSDKLFAAVESGGDEQQGAQAIYYRVTTGLANGSLNAAQASNALERLRFRWRGDLLELKTLRKLAAIYFGEKHWRDGLRVLRVAALSFPNEDGGNQAQDDMRAVFADLFLNGKASSMPPIEALSVFYDFIELTPIGPEGDEMIRRISERLVAADLLGPAADLLQYQVTKRLDGVARAQVATRLAMVQLMDHKPEAVIETLRSTQISTLPDDVSHQRLLMEARALAEEKRWDQALDLIAVDQQPDTVKLRADIYWKSANWPQAGQMAELALGERWNDAVPLLPEERQNVMRAAVAYSLANDEVSLERLRTHFAAKMASSPDGNAFQVVSERIDLHGLAFRNAAAQIASIDTLKAFMKDIRVN